MPTLTHPRRHRQVPPKPTIVEAYDISADAKRRFSLRRTGSKYFKVLAFSDGSYKLNPLKLVPADVTIDKIEEITVPKGGQRLMSQMSRALALRRGRKG